LKYHLNLVLYISKCKKLLIFSSATCRQIYTLADQLALSLLLATAVGIHVVEREGGLIHFGAADIFTLISILQLKANKHKEQICTSELEVQTLSTAHTDTEQICT
jgi:hypothetical protein